MADDTPTITVKKSTDFTMFVPSFIDEYGFSPAQFRIFARIMRRSLGEDSKGCYESIQRLSLNLGISKRIVQESLKILKEANCIRVIKREGTSNLIAFQPCDKWVTKTEFDAIVYRVTGKRIQRDKERKMTPSAETLPSAETHYPLVRNRTTKVLPSKGIPDKNADSKPSDNNETLQPKKDMRGTRMTLNFTLTPQMIEWCDTHYPERDIEAEGECFKDYWLAKAGAKGVKLCWEATWRQWLRNGYNPCLKKTHRGLSDEEAQARADFLISQELNNAR